MVTKLAKSTKRRFVRAKKKSTSEEFKIPAGAGFRIKRTWLISPFDKRKYQQTKIGFAPTVNSALVRSLQNVTRHDVFYDEEPEVDPHFLLSFLPTMRKVDLRSGLIFRNLIAFLEFEFKKIRPLDSCLIFMLGK